jgi:hypothetical protein
MRRVAWFVVTGWLVACDLPMAWGGLVSHYTFEDDFGTGTITNSSSGPSATLEGTEKPTQVADGAIGKAIRFDATKQHYLNAGTTAYPNSTAGLAQGSIAFWIRTTQTATMAPLGAQMSSSQFFLPLLNFYETANDPGGVHMFIQRWVAPSTLQSFRFHLQSGGDDSWADGEWHHLAIAWDATNPLAGAGEGVIYVDGQLQATYHFRNEIAADSFTTWTIPMYIGANNLYGTSTNNYFDGDMDDLRVYDHMLTQEQVTALVNKQEPDTSLLLHFEFDDDFSDGFTDNGGHTIGKRVGAGATQVSDGKFGKAVRFDGTAYIDAGLEAYPNNLGGMAEGTLAFWVRTTSSAGTMCPLGIQNGDQWFLPVLHFGDGTPNPDPGALQMWIKNATGESLRFHLPDGGNDTWWDGTWRHIAFTWDATTGTAGTGSGAIYVDGKPQSVGFTYNEIAADNFTAWTADMYLGANHLVGTGENNRFDGDMDDLRVYNRRLSEAEIVALLGRPSGTLFLFR